MRSPADVQKPVQPQAAATTHAAADAPASAASYLTSDLEALAEVDNYYRWILDEIRPFLGIRLAEVGSGIGNFTKFLVEARLASNPAATLEAFEPAGNLYRQLHDRFQRHSPALTQAGRVAIRHGTFQTSPERFDTIIMVNVLEHIEHDEEFINLAHQSLAPGGTLIVFVPALQRLYSPLDKAVGHYRRYEKTQLHALLAGGGFDISKAKYMDCAGVLSWYVLHVLLRSSYISPFMARVYDRWFVPVTRGLEERWEPFVGKNILMVGRKKMPAGRT